MAWARPPFQTENQRLGCPRWDKGRDSARLYWQEAQFARDIDEAQLALAYPLLAPQRPRISGIHGFVGCQLRADRLRLLDHPPAVSLRTPTTPEAAYSWYREALELCRNRLGFPPINENSPQPGWYTHRFTADGVAVPARIWLVQHVLDGELIADERVSCEIGGDPFNALEVWLSLCQHPISKERFDYLMRVRDWARAYRPSEPEAQPTKPVDFFTVKAPVWAKPKRKTAT